MSTKRTFEPAKGGIPKQARQKGRAKAITSGKKSITKTTFVDSINISSPITTTDILPDFVNMLGEQEILCGGNAYGGNACGGNACGGNAGGNACGGNAGGNACGGNACGGNACGGNACGGNALIWCLSSNHCGIVDMVMGSLPTIVPNTLDELVDYLDIEGSALGGGEQFDVLHRTDFELFQDFTTFSTEDKWPI
ncbi:hypothetical protein DPMN_074519 [Dreissena polymorpha]|uniref:Uncharacterized protein n=1 Tax=Dreissena polymorpha TaxID=45954 RepID=A0A9D3YGE8_DREPO|nr:hypothetical protein DPMN_074519 [Dreissena polymorpha]